MADERRAVYGAALRRAIRTDGRSQKQVAAAIYTSESNLSEIIAGRRLPAPDLANRITAELGLAARDLPELYALARDTSSPGSARIEPDRVGPLAAGSLPDGSSADGSPASIGPQPLPPELASLLRQLRIFADKPPYAQSRQHRLSLSSVYVRQSVSSAIDLRRIWDPELDEPAMVEEDRRVSVLAQPFDEVINQHDHLVIEGAAGLGKSTLGRHLVGELAATLLEPDAVPPPAGIFVPVMVPARTLAAHLDRSWAEALQAAVVAEYGGLDDGAVPAAAFAETIGGLRWLVVVDALDEIPEPADREKLLTRLATRMAATGPTRFLVTSRPLSPGEIARLQGPRVGFFELQPFDWTALEQFAQRRFDPDGTTDGALEAARFLRQVRDAGLEQVLVVPLLASVAAQVFQDRRDRREQSLPSSRYKLYDEYIEQFAAARDATAAAVFGSRCEPALTDWLDAHRTALLERLAVEYTTAETPLLEVARSFLADSAPLPDRLPADWDDLICDWLARTGLLGRHGVRLRFLHQTFAEHLAATAHARALPEAFDPDHPEWAELVTRFLLDADAAGRVLLHYLHLVGPGTGPLAHLQGRSQSEREHAGSLIAQGAPCTDPELDAYLTLVERQTFAGAYVGFGSLAGLTRRPAVRDRLLMLFRHDRVGYDSKIRIVDVLRDRSVEAKHEGGELLGSLTADARQTPERRRAAAEVLARLGAEHRPLVVRILKNIAADPALPADDRRQAAETLATLGGPHRAEAAGLLFAIAADPGASGWERRQAAEELAKLGEEPKAQAADLLYRLAIDRTVDSYYRRQSAEALAKLGGDCRIRAIDAMRQIGGDVSVTGEAERLFALFAAMALEPDGRDRAAEFLQAIAADPLSPPHLARNALQELARYGGDRRVRAARLYHQLATDPASDSDDRLFFAQELGELGGRYRDLAADALARLATDPAGVGWIRLQAAQELARLDPDQRSVAAQALRAMVTATTSDLDDRHEAAQELAKLGRGEREWVSDLWRRTFDDPYSTPEVRLLAAVGLGGLDPDNRSHLAGMAHQLAMASASTDARTLAATFLIGLGTAHLEDVAELLRSSAADPLRDFDDRSGAAHRLAGIGERHRDEAIDLLTKLVTDPAVEGGFGRARVIRGIVALDGGRRGWAADALLALATDPAQRQWHRINAARELAELGQMYASKAAGALRPLLADPLSESDSWHLAVELLARFEPERGRLLDASTRVVRDPDVHIRSRCDAALALAKIADDGTGHAAAALRQAAGTDNQRRALLLGYAQAIESDDDAYLVDAIRDTFSAPTIEANVRAEAVDLLDQVPARHRELVVDIYHQVLGDLALPAYSRQEAGEKLARLGGAHRAGALDTLSDLALDPTLDADHRRNLAETLFRFGEAHREAAVSALHAIATTPSVDPATRVGAVASLIRHAAGPSATEAGLLRELATDPTMPVPDRSRAAQLCAQLGPEWMARILEWANGLLGNGTATRADRAAAVTALCRLRPESRALAGCLLAGLANAPSSYSLLPIAEALLGMGTEHRAQAVDLLDKIIADPAETDAQRLAAARRWSQLGSDQRAPAVASLHEIIDDPSVDAWQRTQAAEWLARFGPEHRQAAAHVLRRIGAEPATTGQLAALRVLARLHPESRAETAAALRAIVADSTLTPASRCAAAMEVARFSDADRERSGEELVAVAAEPTIHLDQRREAAKALFELGGQHRRAALTILAQIVADSEMPADEQARALAALVWSGGEELDRATEALNRAAADATVPAGRRHETADCLAQFGGGHWDRAVTILTGLARDRTIHPAERRWAAQVLLRYGADARAEGVRLLQQLATDPNLDPEHRIAAATGLAEFGTAGVELAVSLLEHIANAPELSDDAYRVSAADRLASLGATARATATTILARVAAGKTGDAARADGSSGRASVDVWTRIDALDGLTRIGPAARRIAADLLRQLADESTVDPLPRALTLAMLTEIDARQHIRAVELLTAIAGAHDGEPGWERLRAIETLLRLSPDHAERGTNLLRSVAADSTLRVWIRRQAAELLARFGRERRREAGRLGAGFAADPSADPWERAECAVALAELDPDRRPAAVGVLRELVADPGHAADQVRYAASLLVAFGPESRTVAVDAFHRLASNGALDGHERRRAADSLLSLGATATADGLELLSQLATDPRLPHLDRALARGRLAQFRRSSLPEAATALTEIATATGEAVRVRWRAATALADLGHPAHTATAVAVLRTIVADPGAEPYEQAMAWHVLAQHDFTQFHPAAAALRRLELTVLDPADRRRTAEALAQRCPSAWPAAVSALRRLVDDPSGSPTDRRRSSATLVRVLGDADRVMPSLAPGIRP